jgi:hypothetical protein
MVLSLLLVGAVAAVVYFFVPHSGGETVRPISYNVELVTARRAAPYPVLAPEGLPQGWRATSVRYQGNDNGHATWHLGFITPAGDYAAVEQSDDSVGAVVAAQLEGAEADGTATVAGQTWDRYQGDRYHALGHRSDEATTLVLGTAPYQDLAKLAAALRG